MHEVLTHTRGRCLVLGSVRSARELGEAGEPPAEAPAESQRRILEKGTWWGTGQLARLPLGRGAG